MEAVLADTKRTSGDRVVAHLNVQVGSVQGSHIYFVCLISRKVLLRYPSQSQKNVDIILVIDEGIGSYHFYPAKISDMRQGLARLS